MPGSRRKFIKDAVLTTGGLYLASKGFSANSYRRILGANDRVNVGAIGVS